MANVRFEAETSLSPREVVAVATDFTERRPELWPAISRKHYEVYDVGPAGARVREGSDVMGGIWAIERYTWTDDTVTATVERSSIFKRGTWTLKASPKPGGGSIVEVHNHRRARGLKGHVIGAMVAVFGKKMLRDGLLDTLARAEEARTAS